MPRHISIGELEQSVGADLGATAWRTITQADIDAFAAATGDHQWIHVDQGRAAAGPFGRTVAHGFLSLSMLPMLLNELLLVEGAALGVNYGIDRLRFTAPVVEGARVRLRAEMKGCDARERGTVMRIGATIEVEGQQKPAAVADILFLMVPDALPTGR